MYYSCLGAVHALLERRAGRRLTAGSHRRKVRMPNERGQQQVFFSAPEASELHHWYQ